MNTRMMMTNKNVILLLSGGLDSLVSVAILLNNGFSIKKAIYIDYGQKPALKELQACEAICKYYKIELEIIKLSWYKEISKNSALNNYTDNLENEEKSYWMPNRNGLFVNIAGSYADAFNCNFIAIGANREEAETYSDNSIEFVKNATKLFETSTKNSVQVIAPLIEMDKNEIIKKAIELNTPLDLIWSCYVNNEKHCGQCPSCKLLKSALIKNKKQELLNKLF